MPEGLGTRLCWDGCYVLKMYASPYVYVVYNALVYASKVQLNNLTEEAGLDNIVVTVIVCSDVDHFIVYFNRNRTQVTAYETDTTKMLLDHSLTPRELGWLELIYSMQVMTTIKSVVAKATTAATVHMPL